jgi:hypothetical protein
MVERRVNDGVGILGSFRQGSGIFQRSAISGSAGTRQCLGPGFGAGKAHDLVARCRELAKNTGAYEAGGPCQKNTHAKSPALTGQAIP